MSKVRIYDLAKELKLDNKKVIEEVRRFGYDVSVPSNSVPPDIAEKVKSKYFPQKAQVLERRVKLVKHRTDEAPTTQNQVEQVPDVASTSFVQTSSNQPQLIKQVTGTVKPEPVHLSEPVINTPINTPINTVTSPAIKIMPKPEASPSATQSRITQPQNQTSASSVATAAIRETREPEESVKQRIVKFEAPKPEEQPISTPKSIPQVEVLKTLPTPDITKVEPTQESASSSDLSSVTTLEPSTKADLSADKLETIKIEPKEEIILKQEIKPLVPIKAEVKSELSAKPENKPEIGKVEPKPTPAFVKTEIKPLVVDRRNMAPSQQTNIPKPRVPDSAPNSTTGNMPNKQQVVPLSTPPSNNVNNQNLNRRPGFDQNRSQHRPQQQFGNRPQQQNQQNQRPQQGGHYQQGGQFNQQNFQNNPQNQMRGQGNFPQNQVNQQRHQQGQGQSQGQGQGQRIPPKPMAQALHRVNAKPEGGEFVDPQRTTYIPPQDSRKKGRRPVSNNRPPHNKKEEREIREKLPNFQPPPTTSIIPRVVVPVVPKELKPIKLVEGTTVKEFAEKLEVKPKDVVALLLSKGVMATINQTLNSEVVKDIGRDFGYEVSFVDFEEMTTDTEFEEGLDRGEELDTRAPVVTVMGHVDHGKTSLLDAIRKTRVAEGEAGGITQHIGAYSVYVSDPDKPNQKRRVVFLDTPGHEAFTMMRARGAKVTDVVVLVVAADDGVMPQTIEAIEHAKAAGVQIVVAINKIDKPQAQPDRVKQALSDYGLVWDGWGGDTVMVEVSAKHRINLNGLLEMILLSADILDLKADAKRLGSGVVLEAKLDKGRGAVATVLVQTGTLKVGDPVIAGMYFGRVRAMFDENGNAIQSTGPATPVEVLGLQGVPSAGDQFQAVNDIAKAQQITSLRQSKKRMLEISRSSAQKLEDLFSAVQTGKLKELLVILKTDVQGSVEVLKDTLQKLSTEKVKVRVIRSGVGAITESDVLLASASNDMAHTAVIIGFNVRPEQRAEEIARTEKVDVRLHSIIYKVEEEIRNAMIGMLDATLKEVPLGKAEIRQIIKIPKYGNIAGVMVIEGTIKRTAKVRLIRDGILIHESQLSSLRRFKDDVSEVKQGFECGIGIDKYSDIKIGDILEVYTTEKVTPTEL